MLGRMIPPDVPGRRADAPFVIREASLPDQGNLMGIYADDTIVGAEMTALSKLVATYAEEEASRLWVAELPDAGIVGAVGVWHADDHVAELRRLRVARAYRKRGIGTRLVETALSYCRDNAYLKIVLDTYVNRAAAIALFEKFGFELTRTRDVDGKRLHDFYLNLYREVTDP